MGMFSVAGVVLALARPERSVSCSASCLRGAARFDIVECLEVR
jgi:hypothetical protein